MTDQRAGEVEEAEVDVGAAFVAGPQPFERVQPGETSFDDPADLAQAGAVRDAAAGDQWADPALAQAVSVGVGVVAAVAVELAGSAAGSASAAADRRDRIHEWQ